MNEKRTFFVKSDDGVDVRPLQELVEIEKRMTADLERRQHQYKRRSDEGEGERTLDQVYRAILYRMLDLGRLTVDSRLLTV